MSVVALSETARLTPRSEPASFRIPGTCPAVERVIRRGEKFAPCSSQRIRKLRSTSWKFSNGSPMPIRTMLEIRSPAASPSCRARTSPTISAAVRLRRIPMRPVKQNRQARGHPTCVEMQAVSRSSSGISTLSISSPSRSPNRNFRVPSVARCWRATSGRLTVIRPASVARRSRESVVIALTSVARRAWTHWKSCRPRYRASPNSTIRASISSRRRPVTSRDRALTAAAPTRREARRFRPGPLRAA
ncbi:MAG: hypothetical protein H6Q85_664 [candidate division NC10 bacterium]|nr:hypothetical protein [candidate division NC10 bacterium]